MDLIINLKNEIYITKLTRGFPYNGAITGYSTRSSEDIIRKDYANANKNIMNEKNKNY